VCRFIEDLRPAAGLGVGEFVRNREQQPFDRRFLRCSDAMRSAFRVAVVHKSS
jgi:hypothetical protein